MIESILDRLDHLWQLRSERETQFGDMVAHLQGLLVGAEPDAIPGPQTAAIREVLGHIAANPNLTDSDIQKLEAVLIRAGCDVFRELA